mmetsp:Transcript_4848/g.7172  ORF Transcript_4848/g.7172 Transcript_4848/m.7172 type:complete len:902 (+) Transcript_4848:378-3083(+)
MRTKDTVDMIAFATRFVAIGPGLIIAFLFFLPFMAKKPLGIEILSVLYTIFFVLSLCIKYIWVHVGPNGVASIGTTCIFMVRMRITGNIWVILFNTLIYGCFNLPGVLRPQLTTSSLPYLEVVYVFSILLAATLCMFFIEIYMRKLFVVNAKMRETKNSIDEKVKQSQKILENILPANFVEQAKKSPYGFIQEHNQLCVLFSDLVSFTSFSSTITAAKLFNILNRHFSTFDNLAEQLKLEKVKTIGDAYFCIGFEERQGTERCVMMGHLMIKKINEMNIEHNENFRIRIGLAEGPSTLCVMGSLKITFDGFGKSVTEAQHMEETSEPNRVHVNQEIVDKTKAYFDFDEREDQTYLLANMKKEMEISEYISKIEKVSIEEPLTEAPVDTMETLEISFKQMPPMITRNNLSLFLKGNYTSLYNSNTQQSIDTEEYSNFIQKPQEEQQEEKTQKYPRFSRITTLFHSKAHFNNYFVSSYSSQHAILLGMGFLSTFLYIVATVFYYNTVYFENLPIQFMTSLGIGQCSCIIINIIITTLFIAPFIRKYYIIGLLYTTLLTLNLIAFLLVSGFHLQEKTTQWIFRPFYYCITSIFVFIPTIPLFLKLIIYVTCMIVPYTVFNVLVFGFEFTILLESISNVIMQLLLSYLLHYIIARIYEQKQTIAIQVEQLKQNSKRNQELLHSSLPPHIVKKLNENATTIMTIEEKNTHSVDIYDDIKATNVMFVKFYGLGAIEQSEIGIHFLNDMFSWFDLIAVEFGMLKIKSIGTTYIAMCEDGNSAAKCALAFLHITNHIIPIYNDLFKKKNQDLIDTTISVKIGMHCGPVSAGILGVSKFLYDIFGDTVNVSSRMCTLSKDNSIQLTKLFVDQLNDPLFHVKPRGSINVKGKGQMDTFFLCGYSDTIGQNN